MISEELARTHSASSEKTIEVGKRIGEKLPAGSVVLLIGPLGAGKTTLAQGIALGLGIGERIISPTYTIVSEYQGPRTLHLIDLYRIEGRDQIDNLGLDDILWDSGVTLVEWGEKIEADLAGPYVRISLDITPDGGRDIVVEKRASGGTARGRTARGAGREGAGSHGGAQP